MRGRAVAAVVLLVGVALGSIPVGGGVVGGGAVGGSPEAGGAGSSRTGDAHPVRPTRTAHTMLIVGASYTAGMGAHPSSLGYADLVGNELGWKTAVFGVPGTGYLNPGADHGPSGGTFAQRIERITLTFSPQVVLLQGGRNDAGYDRTQLRAAVLGTVAEVRSRYPGARVVLLGNIPAEPQLSAAQLAVEQLLQSVSAADHAPFIDPIAEGWITRQNARGYQGQVPGHPNDAGYAYIAHRLAFDLRRLIGDPPAGVGLSHAGD